MSPKGGNHGTRQSTGNPESPGRRRRSRHRRAVSRRQPVSASGHRARALLRHPDPWKTRARRSRPARTARDAVQAQCGTPLVGRGRGAARPKPSTPARPIEALAEEHKRSRWAIEARLARLGKIPEPPGARFPIRRNTAAQARAVYSTGDELQPAAQRSGRGEGSAQFRRHPWPTSQLVELGEIDGGQHATVESTMRERLLSLCSGGIAMLRIRIELSERA